MGVDEEGSLAAFEGGQARAGGPQGQEHRGRIVKTTGDGLLVELCCSVEVQGAMAARNATVPPEQRIEFRMGIDLGDIIKDGRDIYGDGVNVASLNVVVLGCSIQLI